MQNNHFFYSPKFLSVISLIFSLAILTSGFLIKYIIGSSRVANGEFLWDLSWNLIIIGLVSLVFLFVAIIAYIIFRKSTNK